jgi:hypothetical protein
MSSEMRHNHDYIAEQDLIGRYIAGTLPYDERLRFEAHFVDCPRCLDALEDVEPFQSALHAFAAEDAASVVATTPLVRTATVVETPPEVEALPAVTTSPARRWKVWMSRAGALAAVAVVAVGVVELARMERKLARATAVGEISERQLKESEQHVKELSQAAHPGRATSSTFTALVFPLVKARGEESDSPQNRVTFSGSPEWVVLLVDLVARPSSNRYRAKLDTIAGLQVWSDDRLTASSADSIAVGVPSRVLANGDYVLWLDEQAASSDEWRPAGRYTFRVTMQAR